MCLQHESGWKTRKTRTDQIFNWFANHDACDIDDLFISWRRPVRDILYFELRKLGPIWNKTNVLSAYVILITHQVFNGCSNSWKIVALVMQFQRVIWIETRMLSIRLVGNHWSVHCQKIKSFPGIRWARFDVCYTFGPVYFIERLWHCLIIIKKCSTKKLKCGFAVQQ